MRWLNPWESLVADRRVMAASRLLVAAAACVILTGRCKLYWGGCINAAMICQQIFFVLALVIFLLHMFCKKCFQVVFPESA